MVHECSDSSVMERLQEDFAGSGIIGTQDRGQGLRDQGLRD
jgi:hypothetical protein